MDFYREQTEPLIAYYRAKNKLTDVDAAIETKDLLVEFKKMFKN